MRDVLEKMIGQNFHKRALPFGFLLALTFAADEALDDHDGTTYLTLKPDQFGGWAQEFASGNFAGAIAEYYSIMYSKFDGKVPYESLTNSDLNESIFSRMSAIATAEDEADASDVSRDDGSDEESNDDSSDSSSSANAAGTQTMVGLVYGAAIAGAGFFLL